MSLKTTPRGLLALLAVIGLLLLQLPAVMGGATSASARTITAAQAHPGPAPRTIVNPGQPLQSGTVFETPSNGPVGVTVLITATAAVSSSLVITFTDSAGTATQLASTTISGTVGISVVIPATAAAGTGSMAVNVGGTVTALPFTVNTPTASVATSPGSTPTRGSTETVTLDNYAPGHTITATLVYSNASTLGISTTVVATATPSSDGTVAPIAFTLTPSGGVDYGSTATISVTSDYLITPTVGTTVGMPTITIAPAPTFSITPTAVGSVGVSQTLSLSSTSNGGFNIPPGSTITFTVGGPASADFVVSDEVVSPTAGTFTATLQLTPTVAGTYLITATDLNQNNTASSTFQVGVPAAPVATSYFADGYTGGAGTVASHQIINLLNPNTVPVVVTDTYIIQTASGADSITSTGTIASVPNQVVVTHTVPAGGDVVVDMAGDIASQNVITGPNVGTKLAGTGLSVSTIVQTAGFTDNPAVRGVAASRTTERTNGTALVDGDTVLATSNANTSSYFAEGYTGITFQEYLVLFNPSPTLTATVTMVLAPEGGATTAAPLGPYVIAPYNRATLNIRRLNLTGPRSVGLIVNSDNPIVAEQSEFFGPGSGSAKAGMVNAQGFTTAAKQLNFAYGSLTGGFDVSNPTTGTIVPNADAAQSIDDRPFITVMNPNIAGQIVAGTISGSSSAPGPAAHVTIQLRGEDGRLLGFFISDVDAGARFTLTQADLTSGSGGIGFPGVPTDAPTRAGLFSAVVSSSERVVAQLTDYYGSATTTGDANAGAPGIALVGAPSGETDVLFPNVRASEVIFGAAISNTLTLYNPGVNSISVTGAFYGSTGVITRQTYTIAPDQIQIIGSTMASAGGAAAGAPMPAGTLGVEFSTVQQRGSLTGTSGEPGQDDESFVAAEVTHSSDGTNWWGTQGYYPLPTTCSTATGCP